MWKRSLLRNLPRSLLLAGVPFADSIRVLPRSRGQSQPQPELEFELELEPQTETDRERVLPGSGPNVPVNVPSDPDDHLVTSLPLLDPHDFTTKHWAGHLPSTGDGDNFFFYWLFAPDLSDTMHSDESEVPLLIWINGGPACSSMDGLFIENGPFRLTMDPETKQYRVTTAPYSWHKTPAYTLYIDQPVGTGLSFTTSKKYPTNDQQVNEQFYYFLQQFFQLHADKFVDSGKQKLNRNLFFSGESYAGHYLPSLINYMLQKKDAGVDQIEIDIHGAAIGNGWTDPFYQYAGADFAYGHGLIGLAEVAALKEKEKLCQAEISKGHFSVSICFALIDDIMDESHGGKSDYKASSYDIRMPELRLGSREFPPGHKVVETYLGGWKLPPQDPGMLDEGLYKEVLEAIHASAAIDAKQRYKECTDPPFNALSGNDGKGVVDDVVAVLEHPDDVQLLFFNGMYDIVCNHVGNEVFLEKLPWEHTQSFALSTRYAWVAQTEALGKVSGYMREFRNLKFLKLNDAGHMVPMDIPSIASDMMQLFMYGYGFDTNQQSLERSKQNDSCPVCPTCEEADTSSFPKFEAVSTSDTVSGRMGVFVVSYAWLVAGLGVVAFLMVLVVVSRRSNGSASRSALVPQYELELRDASYQDEVDEPRVV